MRKTNALRAATLVIALSLTLGLSVLGAAHAADTSSSSSTSGATKYEESRPLSNPISAKTIPEAIGNASRIFIGVAGSLALLAFIWGGLLMLTSGGAEDRIKRGKQILTTATIGLLVIFGSYAMLRLFITIFGLS